MAMKGCVDITGLGYPEVLLALYKGAKPVPGKKKTEFTLTDALEVFEGESGGYIPDIAGAYIHVVFSGDVFDVQLYDAYNGEGTAQAVVDELRREKAAESLQRSQAIPELPATSVAVACGREQKLLGTAASITPAMLRAAAQSRGS